MKVEAIDEVDEGNDICPSAKAGVVWGGGKDGKRQGNALGPHALGDRRYLRGGWHYLSEFSTGNTLHCTCIGVHEIENPRTNDK